MAQIRNRKGIIRIILGFFLLGIIFMSSSVKVIANDTSYEVATEKGTETYIVNKYNEDKWEDIVDDELEPDDWFEGDSDEIGAKSKLTIRNVDDYEWDMFEVLMTIFDVMNSIPDDLPVNNDTMLLMAFFSEDFIDDLYSDNYQVWEALTVKWRYEIDEFNEEPDDTNHLIPIFKDPKDFKELLENYNEWATMINFTMISLGLVPYQILDGDDFLWQLIRSGIFTIARPFNTYLRAVVDELDCKDVEVKEETLILKKDGKEDYIVEITFNDQGILSNIIVKTSDNRIIYEIVEDTTDIFILIAMVIIIAISLAGIIYIVLRKRNLNK